MSDVHDETDTPMDRTAGDDEVRRDPNLGILEDGEGDLYVNHYRYGVSAQDGTPYDVDGRLINRSRWAIMRVNGRFPSGLQGRHVLGQFWTDRLAITRFVDAAGAGVHGVRLEISEHGGYWVVSDYDHPGRQLGKF